ncbi:MAG: hypothetical protein PHR23_06560 [bacterium]|jgi:hypothetical protein|nr:hypothetical protein [bacterium]
MNKIALLAIVFMVVLLSPCHAFEIPMSTWKGAGEAIFKGKCVDSHTGDPIENFSARRGSENLIQVQTEEDNYKFFVQMTALNGKKYRNNIKTITTWGPGVRGHGYFNYRKGI